ncbi:MAG: GNAT family N-acetyltransferase [Oscillospiraceae bacterium]
MLPCQAVLERNPLLYVDIIEALRRDICQVLYTDEAACLLGFPHGDKPITEFTTLCADPAAAERVFAKLPWDRDILFAVHEDHCLPVLRDTYHVQPFLGEAFYQMAYLQKEPVPVPESPFSVRPLDVSYLSPVAEIHKEEDEGYLRDRLESGVMLGAFDGDILIGFIGVHGEGAMGLLQVHPDYRRRGVGKLLEAHQINHHLAWGETPYGSVLTANTSSLALQRSLGMTASVPTFHWFFNE